MIPASPKSGYLGPNGTDRRAEGDHLLLNAESQDLARKIVRSPGSWPGGRGEDRTGR